MQNKLFAAQTSVFVTSLILSLSALGLSGHWISASLPFVYNFELLGIVASTLSIIVLSTFLIVGTFRKNAIVTIIGVQLPFVIVLSVAFLAEGIISNDTIKLNFPFGCNDPFDFSPIQIKFCNELVSLKGISFAIFAIMLIYWLPLLVMVIIELTHGRNTLKFDIREAGFSQRTQVQANIIAGGIMQEMGIKNHSAHVEGQHEQHQIQLQGHQQQFQLQEQQDPQQFQLQEQQNPQQFQLQDQQHPQQFQLEEQHQQQLQLQQLQLQQLQQQQQALLQQQMTQQQKQ